MKPLLFLMLACLPSSALAVIAGPTTSTTGYFTLHWQAGQLREVTSAGAHIATYTGTSHSFSKPSGTYYFQEWWCGTIPFVGGTCFPVDNIQVSVTSGGSGATYPESVRAQAGYDYQIRAGDFDNNGRTDLYVERLTSGPADGSMQSYVVWNNANGTISTTALTSSYASSAQSAPVNTVLNLLQTDVNADGFSDHIIERVDQVMGSQLEQELAVFAPGTAANKTAPQGNHQLDDNFKSFFLDIAHWMNDQTYFASNITTTTIPIYSVGFICWSSPWHDLIFGFFGGFCSPYFYVVGYQTVQYGVNFSAMTVSTYMNNAAANGHTPSENDLWLISQVAKNVVGVHLFGFDDAGNRQSTNHASDDDAENRFWSYYSFIRSSTSMAQDESSSYPVHEHDFKVETVICSTSQSWCTLQNIACWGRHYHAPLKVGGYGSPAANGEEAVLETPVGTEDPVKVGVGTAANLPQNAIGNITLPGHVFHNDQMGQWGTCPQTVPNQGEGTPPAACNQTYREPYEEGGSIKMRTRGTGEHNYDWINQRVGRGLFDTLDEMMIEAILDKADRLCPSL